MRLLAVTWGFPRKDQRFLVNKFEAIAARGHEVRVLCARGDDVLEGSRLHLRTALQEGAGKLRPALVVDALRRDRQFVGRALTYARARRSRRTERFELLGRLLPFAGERPDVVMFEFANWAAAHVDVLPLLTCPIVVTCHGSDVRVEGRLDPNLQRRLTTVFSEVDRVVCVSHELAVAAKERGADPAHTAVIAEGIDTRFFAPSSESSDHDSQPARLVSVGRLHWVKGYEDALRAVRVLRDRGHEVSYTIVGQDEGAGQAVRHTVRDLRLEQVVRLTGSLDRVGVRNVLSASDIFLLPSLSEGLCQAALEAMAMELPVVTTDVGGMSEAVGDGEHGYVVPPRDPEALANAIESLLEDDDRRRAFGRAGADHVRAHFSSDVQIDRLVALLTELVEN